MTRFRLKDLRDLFVVVIHPSDSDGQAILEQMNRIGCRTELIWPPARVIPPGVDVVFAGLFFDSRDELRAMLRRSEKPGPAIIGVVDERLPIKALEFVGYTESPAMLMETEPLIFLSS
jgi:AmiR/NasT family two-component response regulator